MFVLLNPDNLSQMKVTIICSKLKQKIIGDFKTVYLKFLHFHSDSKKRLIAMKYIRQFFKQPQPPRSHSRNRRKGTSKKL